MDNPQVLMASIHEDYIDDNEEPIGYDYNIADSLDYIDTNPPIMMATIIPYSDSIVIPVSIAGYEVWQTLALHTTS
jgi:hypothetical protein